LTVATTLAPQPPVSAALQPTALTVAATSALQPTALTVAATSALQPTALTPQPPIAAILTQQPSITVMSQGQVTSSQY
jgi:hypothetical protein